MSVELAMALFMSESDAVPPEESSTATTRRKRIRKGTSSLIEFNGPMTDSEREAWDRVKGLLREMQEKDRQLNDSMNLSMDVQHQLQESVHKFEDFKSDFEIPAMSLDCIDKHKRKRGEKLSMDERCAVKHLHEIRVLENLNGKYVATGNPILRTSLIWVVTVMCPHKRLMDSWPTDIVIRGHEIIRKTMHTVKLKYKKVGKTINYTETADIRAKKLHYLRGRESDKFKEALFLYGLTSRTVTNTTFAARSLGYIVIGVNELYTSKKCPVCEGFVSQANIRLLHCPTCETNVRRDVMAGHNIANIVRHHLVHQQRPLYLQPIDSQGRYPWMDGSSSSSNDGGNGSGSNSGSESGSGSGSDRKRQEQGPEERPHKKTRQ